MKLGWNSRVIYIASFAVLMRGNWLYYLMDFKKKSQKTPIGELDKAVKIMNDYFDEKLKDKQHESKKSKK
jgi:phage-related protein